MKKFSRKLVALFAVIILLSTLGTKAAQINYQSLGQNGCRKYEDGFLIQWGYSSYSGASQYVYFPLAFYDSYSITFGIPGGADTPTSLSIIVTDSSTTYFKAKGTMGNSTSPCINPFHWIAVGRWKK